MSKLCHHTIMVQEGDAGLCSSGSRGLVVRRGFLRFRDLYDDFILLLLFFFTSALYVDNWSAECHVSAHWKIFRSCSIQMSAVVLFIFIIRIDFLIPHIAQMSLSCLIRQVCILLHHNGEIWSILRKKKKGNEHSLNQLLWKRVCIVIFFLGWTCVFTFWAWC